MANSHDPIIQHIPKMKSKFLKHASKWGRACFQISIEHDCVETQPLTKLFASTSSSEGSSPFYLSDLFPYDNSAMNGV